MRDKIKEIAIKTIKTMCETAVGCIMEICSFS